MAADVDVLLARAREAKRESRRVEFKEQFNPAEESEWIELIKDFAALANSGGGVIIVGLRNNGTMLGADVQPVLDLDGAVICDKLRSYVGEDFDDFEISEVTRGGGRCRDGVQAHRISTDPVAGRQRTPPRRAGPCRRGIQERQAHRTTRRIRGW
jgi:hypothetical protein